MTWSEAPGDGAYVAHPQARCRGIEQPHRQRAASDSPAPKKGNRRDQALWSFPTWFKRRMAVHRWPSCRRIMVGPAWAVAARRNPEAVILLE